MSSSFEGLLDGSAGARAAEPEEVGLAVEGRDDLVGVPAGVFGLGPLAARPPSFGRLGLVLVAFTVCARDGLALWVVVAVASTTGSATVG
jgi:hypothetical protein